jgi:outer membrane protein assembly factor BamB
MVAPPTLSVTPGANGQVTLSSTALNGFSGTIAVAVQGLPTGVTVSPTTLSLTSGNPLVVTLTAASDAPATTTPVQVSFVGTSGSLSHTATLQLTVNAVGPTGPDFTIAATPNAITVAQGAESDTVEIGVTGINGFSGNVTFGVSGLPTGVTVIPSQGTLESGWMDPVVFVVAADATIGTATVTITGTSGVLTHTATLALTVSGPAPLDFVSLALSPSSETITTGSIGTVSVTATATEGYTGPVNVSATNLPTGITLSPATAVLTPGVAQTFTVIAGGTATPGTYTVTFVGQVNSVNGSAPLALTVVNPTSTGLDVPTWHYDMGRTGLDSQETSLTPTSVSATFGKRQALAMDGAVDAQPLYLSGMTMGAQGTHNVLYVATENDSVYALDASSGAQLWKTSALKPSETAADNQGCNELSSQVGITSTPVIDRYYGTDGAIYFVAKTKDSGANYHQRLHALDLTTGAELAGSPVDITATYPANGGVTQTFDPGIFVERSALLLSQGTVYLSWGAPCQQTSFDYDSWEMAYNEATLAQQSVLDLTPNGSGGGIWMSGAGPAADQYGSVFLATSEGTFDTTLDGNGHPVNGDYGNGYVEIQGSNGVMSAYDYFEPLNGVPGSANYQDQGSGGILLMPDVQLDPNTTLSLAVGAGRDGNIYEFSRIGDSMGEYDGQNDNDFFTMSNALPNGASSTPAYFEGILYYGGNGDLLKAFIALGFSNSSVSQSTSTLGPAGATPVISANGTDTPIVWVLDTTASGGPALYAYNAEDLSSQLYSSSTKSGDAVGATSAHAVPVVANGSVYVGTESGITIFGLQ